MEEDKINEYNPILLEPIQRFGKTYSQVRRNHGKEDWYNSNTFKQMSGLQVKAPDSWS